MSHFTVCVRVTAEKAAEHGGCIEDAVAAMLAPYQENNMGDCPGEYLKFHDTEDKYLKEYQEGSTEMVRLPDGKLVYPWDEQFRVPGTGGLGGNTHEVPAHLKEEPIFHRDRYATFETFVADWHGGKGRDEKTGRFGYWENPNAKWDWYQIGGRWTGHFPVKVGRASLMGKRSLLDDRRELPDPRFPVSDIVSIDDLDTDRIAAECREKAESFWGRWLRLIAGEKLDWRDDPRGKALSLGLIVVRQGLPLPGEESRAIPWSKTRNPDDPRYGWHDVYRDITKDQFMSAYADTFNPIATYAILDDAGWRAPGEMGWFGCSSDKPESYVASKQQFMSWVRESPADATLVVVDCHI